MSRSPESLHAQIQPRIQTVPALRLPSRRHQIGPDIGHKRARSLNTMIKPQVTFPVAEGVGIFVGIVAWDLLTDGRVDIAKALLIATPFALGSSIFMTEISPKFGEKFYRPMVEIFAGIPSVVYGWVGLTVLIPFLKKVFDLQVGHSILAASLVLSIMIFPSITSVASDAIRAVSKETRMAAYGLGSTRWQTIYRVVIPAALPGIISGIVLGLARAFGEALAVAMVIGQTTALPKSIFSTSKTLTTEIAAQMGNAMEGGEMKAALWTMALLLFLISLLFITIIHKFSKQKGE